MRTTISTSPGLTINAKSTTRHIIYAIKRPNMIPIIPPVKVRIAASARNCVRMEAVLAPRDLRIPISLVLSVTDTVMIFITPISPTRSEIAAIIAITEVMISRIVFVV